MTDPFNRHCRHRRHSTHTRSHTDLRHHADRSRGRRRVRGRRARCGRRRRPTPPPPAVPKGPTFAELGLHPDVLRAVEEMGFTEPMPVQAATFPLITAGSDLMVQSRTGSGKTAAFGIPFANGIVNGDEQVRAGDRAAADARAGAAGGGRAGQDRPAPADHGRPGLRRRADGPADRAAARAAARSCAARRDACSTTCAAAR